MNTSENKIGRAAAYLKRIPPAVSGERGSNPTFRAACVLARFGLTADEALGLMREWNRDCKPQWSEAELRHKVEDAIREVGADTRFSEPSRAGSWAPSNGASPEVKRQRWPAFENPTAKDLETIAKKRCLGVAGLELAVERGLLWITSWYGHRCWAVTDSLRRAAQLRRLDGRCFVKKSGESYKAHTLSGSICLFPIGLPESVPFEKIMVVEGAPDLLAAHHFMRACDRTDVAAVCMLGGAHRLAESALLAFQGKTVWIYPHIDKVGFDSVPRWCRPLSGVVRKLHVVDFSGIDGSPVKDLNDLAKVKQRTIVNQGNLCDLLP